MIIGHEKQKDILKEILEIYERGAFILTGPEAIGKFSLIKELSKEYFKDKEDLILIDSQDKILKLSTAKFLQKLLRITTESKRIIIVNDAHKLNKEAQNSLLKIIEEIQTKALLFFVTSQQFQIYPTIRSRMQNIKFYFVSSEKIIEYLKEKNIDDKTIKILLEIFKGQIGKIIKILNNREIFNYIIKIYNSKDLFEKLILLSKIEDKIELNDFLFYLILFERKKMLKGDKKSIYKIKFFESLYQDSNYFLNKNLQLNNLLLNIL